jgi:hypothetical protein
VERLLLISVLFLAACTPELDDSASESCDGSTGTLWGDILDYDGNPHGGSTVVYISPDGEDGYALPAVDDAYYEVELTPGHYVLAAESDWGCFSDPDPEVDIEACGDHQADLIMDLCYGR